MVDQEAIFIDGTKVEANANKFTFVWKKSVEKSNQVYEELLEKEIMPEIERENEEEFTLEELTQLIQIVDEVVSAYDRKNHRTSKNGKR